MRIIIESHPGETLSVAPELTTTTPQGWQDAADGGSPPTHLLESLGASHDAGISDNGEEAVHAHGDMAEPMNAHGDIDAGSAPAFLAEVIDLHGASNT